MPACRAVVDPGACRLRTTIVARPSEDGTAVSFEVESECGHVREWASRIGTVDPFEAMCQSMTGTPFYTAADGALPHAACPCPCAMAKAMEVAAGLGVKRDVSISIVELDGREPLSRDLTADAVPSPMTLTIEHDEAARRFAALEDGREVGRLTYVLDGGTMTIDHTFVDPERRGRRIGSLLVSEASAYGRGRGLEVVETCSFAAARNSPSRRSPAERRTLTARHYNL